MSNYTPTTEMIRRDYCYSNQRPDICGKDFGVEFDRWYAEEIRKAKEEAWFEGAESAFYNPEIRGLVDYPDKNPYRKETE